MLCAYFNLKVGSVGDNHAKPLGLCHGNNIVHPQWRCAYVVSATTNILEPSGSHDMKLKYRIIFWPIFGLCPAKLGRKTPPDGSGSKNGVERI
jgi:hypothetical protein